MSRGSPIGKKKHVAKELGRKKALRNKAEDILRKKPKSKITRTPEEVQSLIHELEVHQIELEMQNEELRLTQLALLESCDHYADLYDYAPVGYITINDKGLVLGANITVADLLGTERGKLANKRFSQFIFEDDQDIFYKFCLSLPDSSTERLSCEVRMKTGGQPLWAKLDSVAEKNSDADVIHYRISITDINDLKRAEEKLRTVDNRLNHVFELMKSGVGVYNAVDGGDDFIVVHSYRSELSELFEINEDLTGKRLLEIFPAVKKLGLLDVLKRVWHTGKPENHPVTIYDGENIIGWRENYIFKLSTGEIVSIYEDITERKKLDKALHDSELLFRSIFETSPNPININRLKDGKFITINYSFLKLIGYAEREVIGKTALDINVWHDLEKRKLFFDILLKDGKVEDFEAKFRRKDGSLLTAQVSSTLMMYKNEEHLLAITRDITDLKNAEKALQKSHEQLKQMYAIRTGELEDSEVKYSILVEALLTGVYMTDKEEIVFTNGQFAKIFGYENHELQNKNILEIIHPQDKEKFKKVILAKDNEGEEFEIRGVKKSGETIYLQGRNSVLDIKGRSIILGNITDITKRKLIERTLNENRSRLIKAEQVAHMGFLDWNLITNEIKLSKEMYDLYGIDPGMVITVEQIEAMVHPDDIEFVKENLNLAIKGSREYNIDHRMVRADGNVIWVHARADLERDKDGRPGSLMGTVIDITERKQAEMEREKIDAELRILSTKLMSAEERERKRIANEIHDSIGQALSAIKFSIENSLLSLEAGALPSTRKALENIVPLTQQTIEEVRRIIMDLRPSILDDLGLKATISWFCREFETIYSDIDVETAIHVEETDIPVQMKTVIYRILQEVFNNAAKHSRTKHIYLCLEKTRDCLELFIEDQGCGFVVEEVLAGTSDKRGMGLASIHERTMLSGGDISILSAPGAGTKIKVCWPLAAFFEHE